MVCERPPAAFGGSGVGHTPSRIAGTLHRLRYRFMHFAYSIIRIIIVDLVLSGDNAVVIGMAAHRLPMPQRRKAILIGGGAAIALRILLTATAALLLQIPGLQLIGGLLLTWIAFKLLKKKRKAKKGFKAAGTLREAVITILVADFVMSTDNVLGVAGASQGNVG